MQRSKFNYSSIMAIFVSALFVLGCICGKSGSNPPPQNYVGLWKGRDGSTLNIRPDGTSDFKQGGTEITNASVSVSGNSLQLSFFGFAIKEFRIDQPPSGNRMILDGIVYSKSDFGDDSFDQEDVSSKTQKKPNTTSDFGENSLDDETESTASSDYDSLVRKTLLDFNDAIQTEDFSDFLDKSSYPFRQQFTDNDLKKSFSSFIAAKEQVNQVMSQIKRLPVSYTQSPRIRKEKGYDLLSTKGSFDTIPNVTYFDLEFVKEDKWRLIKIDVQIR
ncbi:MAG: hypothetical protein NZM17_05315 [Pyrinomonadaceae bacterium]|nr:hypothetical protein [Pyrinomonadaceae bacterium]